jgi:hypothetical protein
MTTCITAYEAQFDGTNWTDITADVIRDGTIPFGYGIRGNSPTDRVASTGEMQFELRNDAGNSAHLQGYYTPGHSNCRDGFTIGLKIRLRVTYEGQTKTMFYGRIPADGIKPTAGLYGMRRVAVTVRDWIDIAANHEMVSPEFATDKTITEVAALITANMDIAPLSTDYRTGTETFPNVFDTVRSKTRALTELAKVANSEPGYIYLIHSTTADEVLRVEGRYTRNDERASLSDSTNYFVDESGNHFVDESGNYFVGNETSPFIANNAQIDMPTPEIKFYNRVKITSYLRRRDASPVTLATVQSAIYVAAGASVPITLRYKDPTGNANSVSGINMIAPEATTDFLANTLANGGGTNLTPSFTFAAVGGVFGTGDCQMLITNNSASNGYLLAGSKVRGTGVYIDDPADTVSEDTTSITANGAYELTIDQKYQDSINTAQSIAPFMLNLYKTPRLVVDSVKYCANSNDVNMAAFFYLEPGDRIAISEDVTGIDSQFFIQGKEAEILPGDIIFYTFYIKDAGLDTFTFCRWDGVAATDGWDVGVWAI